MSRHFSVTCAAVVLWATAACFSAAFAQGGRLSLADRVAQLERQQQAAPATDANANLELLNRLTQLQSEVQALRGMLEEQDFKLREMERRNRDLAVDFDSRLERLEGGSGTAAPLIDREPATATGGTLGGVVGSVMEEPDVRAPVDGGVQSQPLDGGAAGAVLEPMADPAAERAVYDTAFDALKNGQYAEAARRFQSFLAQYPDGEFAPNAQYWLGESYYVTQNYQIALVTFERLLARFPASNKVPDALLKVGYCHYELRQWDLAESTLNQVIQTYPDSTVARLAQGRLRALRLENR
ncbi:tol-pal system protein YbgF [Denitratimonas tolerans]|uniref:Cell division coordinator CpoB n=2 Tax=Denitratimonas tolerans TaxID=1338420 RepID=A0AAW9R395_9GAMM